MRALRTTLRAACRSVLTAALAVAATTGLVTVSTPANAATVTPDRTVLLVHGLAAFQWWGSTSIDCEGYWRDVDGYFTSHGVNPGRILTVRFYDHDRGCTADIRRAADNVQEIYDVNTPIDRLGVDLAWFIYNRYTRHGHPVTLVGHSMGGLIVRDAVTKTAARVAGYPPNLLIHTNLTVATPHNGTNAALACLGTTQCNNMRPGSEFLRSLPNYVGVGRWLTIGSNGDGVVPCASATGFTHPAVGRWCYYNPAYDHNNILSDRAEGLNARIRDVGGERWFQGLRSLQEMHIQLFPELYM